MSEIPADLKYTKSHEWLRSDGDDTVTVGITDHAQDLLGDLVFVELPENGSDLTAEEACAVVESVKAASDVYAPVNGTVIAVNESLEDSPELVNSSPFEDGWLYQIKMTNPAELDDLLSADDYASVAED